MNGLIFTQLKKYVIQSNGEDLWKKALDEVELPHNQIFHMLVTYPDQQFYDLSEAIVKLSYQPIDMFFEKFGEFLSQYLIETYSKVINPRWKTFELLENVDLYLRRVFGLTDRHLHVVRVEKKLPKELIVNFNCHRKLCWVCVGLIRGVAKYHKENISILNLESLQRNDPNLKIHLFKLS